MRRQAARLLRKMANRLDSQLAQGGPVKKGVRYEIRGERGCELFVPSVPGQVIPRVTTNIQALDPDKVAAALRVHARRNGLGGLA